MKGAYSAIREPFSSTARHTAQLFVKTGNLKRAQTIKQTDELVSLSATCTIASFPSAPEQYPARQFAKQGSASERVLSLRLLVAEKIRS
ncbi:hypothetical protein CC1G_13774 [Coprinopsis cinerea okayama7|uniref:Uncharacterized protein n=1 Tax=Coprinopsis cinerea (strain Okayama-7 / 130 / ATCC MYA-4618 / FGSC 9003) TaxID=240176 RepID=D6RKC1_COPC7|nr:hypothetical protein CC1G_13774 [Coprinopsis cinerea okayama7\|eukprot:XP_002912242.1 hypothetical protein CC1G_13774 [Coprinopsis cinerea okayama7\